jgi:hypothetical protein
VRFYAVHERQYRGRPAAYRERLADALVEQVRVDREGEHR